MKLPIVVLSSEPERRAYEEYFRRISPKNSIVPFPSKSSVFDLYRNKTGLPGDHLSKIWDIVGSNSNTIDQNTFNVGLRLIALGQNGIEPNILGVSKGILVGGPVCGRT